MIRLPSKVGRLSGYSRMTSQSIVATCSRRQFSPSASKQKSISDVIKLDHREIEQYYEHIIHAETKDEKIRYQNAFVWELARHSIGEELVVYPMFEKKLQDGKAMADNDRAEHQKTKEILHTFQGMTVGDSDFDTTIKTLMSDLKQHIKDEEQHDLPKLEEALTKDESKELANSFERSKKFAPTRSHPSAPDKPPFETVVGLMAAPLDKLQDMFRKFPTRDTKEKIPHSDQ